jgi:hypothetical protein
MHQQLWRYKVEEKLHLGVSKQKKRFNTTGLQNNESHEEYHLPRSKVMQCWFQISQPYSL